VGLTAEPDSNLESGQRISFTISVTNHGPEPVAPVSLGSSPIYDELDVFSATVDCGDDLGLAVVDLNDGFYYVYAWFPTQESPLAVGETRNCYLNLEFTEWAPDTFSLTFSMSNYLIDLDASNNSATVTLHRAIQGNATPVPTLSPLALVMLAGLLVWLASAQRARFGGSVVDCFEPMGLHSQRLGTIFEVTRQDHRNPSHSE
jgi:hypothetical protein